MKRRAADRTYTNSEGNPRRRIQTVQAPSLRRPSILAFLVLFTLAYGCADFTDPAGEKIPATPVNGGNATPAISESTQLSGERAGANGSGTSATEPAQLMHSPLPTPTPEVIWPGQEPTRTPVAGAQVAVASAEGASRAGPIWGTDVGGPMIVDHRSVALFDQIPEEYLAAARELHMVYSDRSVGKNISEGLDCLAATSWEDSPAHCRRDYVDENGNWTTFGSAEMEAGRVPERIQFDPDPTRFSRANWTFDEQSSDWSGLTQDFIERVGPTYVNTKDVLSYQFTYLNVTEASDIADPQAGFFADNADEYDIHDLEAYMAQHPDKVFFLWTTSLARGIGTQVATDFNNMMREYAVANRVFLFDVADIESHTHQGMPCYDNRDGVEYCTKGGKCEDYPDDGLDLPAICQDYTTETDGGHLGSVSAGKIAIAKAFWVLTAQIAGWDPGDGA